MKKFILTLFLFGSIAFANAQAGIIWKNAILRSDGQTSLNGVEAFCAKTVCQGEEYVLIKFKNNTNAKVSVEWVDAIFVNQVWYYSANPNPKKFYIDANSTVEGTCGGEIKLQLKINSILQDPLTFEHFTVSGLAINK